MTNNEALIRQAHLHVVHVYVVRRAVAVQIDLERICKLGPVTGEQCVMHDVCRIGHAIDGERIMKDLRSLRVIHGDDVMPGIRSKGLECDGCSFPMLGREIKYAPSLTRVISLPGIVVGIAIGILLAFKLDPLRSRGVLSRDVKVKLVTKIAHRIRHRRLLDEVVAARVCWATGNPEISRTAAQARS